MQKNYLRTILITAGTAILWATVLARSVGAQDHAAAARRIAATAQLAAEEYRLGVSRGRVVAPEEVGEARLFLAEARRNVAALPALVADSVSVALGELETMLARTASPDSVATRVTAFLHRLGQDLGISFDEIPAEPPSLGLGRSVYESTCAACHGMAGGGDGPQAGLLTPRPANLADGKALAGSSPLDFYRRITVGVAGTAMAPYEHNLSVEERWAVALYASTLRLPPPLSGTPSGLWVFPGTARMSDAQLLAAIGPAATPAQVAAIRSLQGGTGGAGVSSRVFATVRAQIDSAYRLAASGRGEAARTAAMDAYVTFERVERVLKVKDPALTARLEKEFADLRTLAGTGATAAELSATRQSLARSLETAERTVVDRVSVSNLLLQSFVLLVREGLEAILVIGALMAFLVKTGNGHRRRDIHKGVGAAVAMSLLTAVALETVFVLNPSHQEGLEGAVLMVATATLFYVSYWLLSKMEVAKWNRFVKGRIQHALTRGSALALAGAAFLAVYREGFETVLFYKALALSGGAGSWAPIAAGVAAGSLVLALVYFAIHRFGVKLPLKPLFGVTSALLYYMAFVFAGKGVADLQESGLVSLTPIPGAPRMPALGIYPTVESLGLQAMLVLLALVALVWTFVVEPRRLTTTRELVPEPLSLADRPAESPPRESTLLRSIDRIETDLAEVRSELERMRENVKPPVGSDK